MRCVLFTLIAGSLSSACLAETTPADDNVAPVALEPSTDWYLHFSEDSCRLARTFGEGEDRHVMIMEQAGSDKHFEFMVAGPAFERFQNFQRTAVQFGELPPVTNREPTMGEIDGIGASLFYAYLGFREQDEANGGGAEAERENGLPRLNLDEAKQIDAITLRGRAGTVVFNTGNMAVPVIALNECGLKMIESWGLDRAQHETMTRAAVLPEGAEFAQRIMETYPYGALRNEDSGVFRMRVIVEADGTISDCVVKQVAVTSSFESPACKVTRKTVQFEPALDKDGHAMRSFYVTTVSYHIN